MVIRVCSCGHLMVVLIKMLSAKQRFKWAQMQAVLITLEENLSGSYAATLLFQIYLIKMQSLKHLCTEQLEGVRYSHLLEVVWVQVCPCYSGHSFQCDIIGVSLEGGLYVIHCDL